jgi:heptosyltransferase II
VPLLRHEVSVQRQRPQRSLRATSLTRLLVVAPNWIGDALMAQPLLAKLRAGNSAARVEVLAPPWVAPVLRRMPEVDKVLEADLRHGELQLGDRWRLGRMLKERGYGAAYVLPNTMKSALAPSFARIPLRVGYLGESRVGLLNRIHKAKSSDEPMPLHYARLAEEPGNEPDLPLPIPSLLFQKEKVKATADRFGIAGRYTVFCPGAEYGPAKRWPYFNELSAKLGSQVVVLGSPGDLKDNRDIPGKNLIGKTTLDEAIDLIAGAAAVVSNDSGLMHIAAATGRPLVALFGSSSPEHTPPQSPAARVLWLKIECSPCFERVCPLGHFRCMKDMTAERVLAELKALA